MRNYDMKHALVQNPKCPVGVSLKWLKFMRKPHLKSLARSKNVSKVIATSAKKRISEIEKK